MRNSRDFGMEQTDYDSKDPKDRYCDKAKSEGAVSDA